MTSKREPLDGVVDVVEARPADAPEADATPIPDERLLAAHDLALAALTEITPAASVGDPVGYSVETDGVVSLRFANRLDGYPGWFWTVSLARVEDADPTVLELGLLPGADALLAPEWVPWAVRLADYEAQQLIVAEAAALAGQDIGLDDDDEDDDEEEVDEDLDDIEDLDAADFDLDGSPILHAGDVDGVDIDELDDADGSGDEDELDDEDEPGDDDELDDEDEPGEDDELSDEDFISDEDDLGEGELQDDGNSHGDDESEDADDDDFVDDPDDPDER